MRITGETTWLVLGLSLPDQEDAPPVEELAGYEAIRLFVERAKAVDAGFALTERKASAVARLCQELDGIPLAIELAAARVRALSVEQISEQLENSLGLLTTGSRVAALRHQTLRATLEWSYELLNEVERTFFGRALSVVIGGVSLSWVVGVPAATLISDQFGWRAGFVLVAALAAVAAVGVGTLLPIVKGSTPSGRLSSRLAVVRRPAVLVTLAVTVLVMAAAFSVLTYMRPLLEDLAGFGAGGIASMLLLFGLAGIAGSVLGGFGADRFGYRINVVTVLIVLTFSLSAFSLLAVVGAAFVTTAAATALAALAVAGFALTPLQQYRLIRTVPDEQNGVLALNEIASDLGQGLGAILGSLILEHASSTSLLGWAGAVCAAVALILSVLGSRFSDKD